MLVTMPSARLPCSAIFSRLPVSIPTMSSISARASSLTEATAGAAHLDDAPVGAGVLEAQFLIDRFETAVEFRLDVGATEFATPGEEADVVSIAQPLRQQRVGQVEDPLEIEVPGSQPQLAVEHR